MLLITLLRKTKSANFIVKWCYNKDGSINYDMVEKTNKKSDWWKDGDQ